MKYVLGSGSPRRKELLALLGISYEVIKACGEEIKEGDTPEEIVENLSRQKAVEVAERVMQMPEYANESVMVFGADTLVAKDGILLGKPKDAEDACRMLRMLQGSIHQVFTGVTVVVCQDGEMTTFTFHEGTEVLFYPVSEEEIQSYVATKEPMDKADVTLCNSLGNWRDKAGAYGIQEPFGSRIIKGINGDYNNVVGLPVARLYQELKSRGLL